MNTQPRKARYRTMSRQEYSRAMATCRLPAPDFTEMIGVSWRQGERYKEGDSPIPDPVAKLIRTIIRHDLAPQDVG